MNDFKESDKAYFNSILTYFFTSLYKQLQHLKKTQLTYHLLLMAIIAFLLANCANPVAPEGGPKDEAPPIILEMDPPNYSPSFDQERMVVYFDEYVQLKGLNQQLMISPPLSETPRIRTKGKSVVIDIDEPLLDSTTYTFYFGDAIVDLNESNPLKNFEYVFSTGTLIDSMAIKGKVTNAFDMMPKEGVAVLLYTLNVDSIPNDSLPILSRPIYVSRTNEKGEFELNNLRNIPYKIIALLDMNSNYLYDLPNEEIAFLDTLVMPAFLGRKVYIPPADTLKTDSSDAKRIKKERRPERQKKEKDPKRQKRGDEPKSQKKIEKVDPSKGKPMINDTISEDPIISNIQTDYKPLELFLFPVVDSTQRVLEAIVSKGTLITFVLKYPCNDFQINPLNFYPLSSWNQLEINESRNEILCWVHEGLPDSLQVEFVADSVILDTLNFVLNKVNPNAIIDTSQVEPFVITSNVQGVKIDLGKKFQLESEYPLSVYDPSGILWIEDSLITAAPIVFKDSVKRVFYFDSALKEKIKYKIVIPDSAFMDTKGRVNDSLTFEFETRPKEEYGSITLNAVIADSTQQWIVQLLDSKDGIINQKVIQSSQAINFEYLLPDTFKLKAILDNNKNGRWDTGNYIQHRQAEKVLMFSTELEVRANWVMEESWELR